MTGPRHPSGRLEHVLGRMFRRALRLLPRRMRDAEGPSMEAAFADRLRAGRGTGPGARLGTGLREVWDVIGTAARLRMAERTHARRGGDGTMGTVLTEIRIAARGLLRRPGYLAIAASTLALGIGANAAMFGVVDQVALRPLAYPDPGRLVMVYHSLPHLGWDRGPLSLHNFLALQRDGHSWSSVGASTGLPATLLDRGDPRRVVASRVSGDWFRTLGVDAALGRTVLAADDRPGAEPVVVLGHDLWVSAFGASPDVLGTSVRLDDRRFTVIGVMPEDFPGLGGEQLWTQLGLDPAREERDRNLLIVVGRLADGATLEEARREADAVLGREAETLPSDRERRAVLVGRHDQVVGGVRQQLLLLLGAVALVLVVACANVAGLVLTRGVQRRHELAVRAALGAGGGRLAGHVLVESALLAAVGGALGTGVAWSLTRAIALWGPDDLPRREALAPDGAMLAFLVAVTALCALACGLWPALRARAGAPARSLKDGGRASSTGVRAQALLAGTQVALATVLLVGAALFGRSLFRLQSVDPGFEPDGVLTAVIPLPAAEPEERAAWVRGLEERLAAHPGVTAVGLSWSLPFASGEASTRAMREDQTLPGDERMRVWVTPVTPDWFTAMGMPLLAGRSFDRALGPGDPAVTVINESLASRLWPGEDPVGKRLRLGGDEQTRVITVAGLVPDTRLGSLDETEERPIAYQAFAQTGWADRAYVALRTSGDPLALVPSLRAAVGEMDDETPVDEVATLDARIGASLARPRFRTALLGGFALLGAILAVVGVYGVLALTVASRTRDIGVHMALGAPRSRVRRDVVARGLRIAGAGLAVGVPVALGLAGLLDAFLFGIGARDALTYGGVVAGVLGAVVLGVLPTALRASSIDPLRALDAE